MRRTLFMVCVLMLLAAVMPVAAQDVPEIVVSGVWARATAQAAMAGEGMAAEPAATEEAMASGGMSGGMGMDGGVSAVYMTLSNPSAVGLQLVSAVTDIAGLVEIHESAMDNGMMTMRHLEAGLPVLAGETVVLEQGGYHVMMMDLKQELVLGSAISVHLTFDVLGADGSATGETYELMVGAPVLDAPPPASPITVTGAWARPTAAMPMEMSGHAAMHGSDATPEGGMNMGGMDMGGGMGMDGGVSAIYATLTNTSDADLHVVGVTLDAAGIAEIHESVMENDMMMMRPLEGGLVIPAGGSAVLEQGGIHMMLMELNREFVPGTAVLVTLTFEDGSSTFFAVPVYDPMMMGM